MMAWALTKFECAEGHPSWGERQPEVCPHPRCKQPGTLRPVAGPLAKKRTS